MKIYDISLSISEKTVIYPGDPPVEIIPQSRISAGDSSNISTLSFGSHTGTHVDPAFHMISDGATVDQVSLELLYGKCLVCSISDETAVTVRELEGAGIKEGTKRIIFKTRNSELWDSPEFSKDFVYVEPTAAEWLLRRGVQVIGVDYLSIDPFHSSGHPAHLLLMTSGAVIIEGLDLRGVPPGTYTLACLPLKIAGGDGGPARAILIDDRM